MREAGCSTQGCDAADGIFPLLALLRLASLLISTPLSCRASLTPT